MMRHDYSLSERAVGLWASLTLGILAVTSLGLRYVTNPIACWTPVQFTRSHVQYSHDYCFDRTEKLYNIGELEFEHRSVGLMHTYHQWVPFTLGMGAILCVLPHVLWRTLSAALWLDTHTLVQTLADNQRHNAAGRHVLLKDSALVVMAGLRGGNWILTAAAMGRKLVACVVCVLQMVVIVVLFQPQLDAEDARSEDHNATQRQDRGDQHSVSTPLPQHFFCDMSISQLTNVHFYTLQCTLLLSQVYSKGFTFLFYLFLLLTLCCVADILICVGRLALPGLRDSSLRRYLAVSEADTDPHLSVVVSRFLDTMGMDGRMLVAVTVDVCGPVAAADLTLHLWMTFRSSCRPGTALSDPAAGTVPGPVVSTVPPSHYAPPPAPVAMATSSGDPDAVPLIPLSETGEEVKGAHA